MAPAKPDLDFEPPSTSVVDSFKETPWAHALFSAPHLHAFLSPNLIPKSNTHDSLIAETLSTSRTIAAWQSFYCDPVPTSEEASTQDASFQKLYYVTLLKLGSGMNGQANLLHGGALSFIFDECMRLALQYTLISEPTLQEEARKALSGEESGPQGFTATITTNFKKPIVTPGVVLCKAWVDRRNGKKFWVKAELTGGPDGGTKLGDAEALFIVTALGKPKL